MTDPTGRPSQAASSVPDDSSSGVVTTGPGDRENGGSAPIARTSMAVERADRDAQLPAFLDRIRAAPARVVRPGGPRERQSAPMALAAVCPFLSGPEGAYRAAAPARDHRCGAVDPPERLPVEKQQQLCLRTRHFECPAFIAATAPGVALTTARPVPRSAPLVLERADPVVSFGAINLPARATQIGLAGLLVVALAIVVLGTGGGPGPAANSGPSASPRSSAVAAASDAVRRTPRPSSSAAPAGASASATPDPTATTSTRSIEPTASTEPTAGTGASTPNATVAATPAGTPKGSVASGRTYKVKKGDTLSEIAARFGTTVKVLQELNDIKDPRLLKVGQILKLP
jgi:LysM repeat protein